MRRRGRHPVFRGQRGQFVRIIDPGNEVGALLVTLHHNVGDDKPLVVRDLVNAGAIPAARGLIGDCAERAGNEIHLGGAAMAAEPAGRDLCEVGLVLPHIARILVGSRHRGLLPVSAVLGAVFLLWADTIARTTFAPLEVPVGVITALVGVPIFAAILIRTKKR